MKAGEFVQTWFDTGAGKTGGMKTVYGLVIAAGPKTFRVRWENGATGRVRRDDPKGVRACPKEELDSAALRRLEISP